MSQFTPISALVGGSLIGVAAVLLLWCNGRIAGISGIMNGAFTGPDVRWRRWFLLGLIAGGAIWAVVQGGTAFALRQNFPVPLLLVAGFLVGYGTRLGSGCTSGHGVCGIARLSKRSIIATITFMATAMLTVYLIKP